MAESQTDAVNPTIIMKVDAPVEETEKTDEDNIPSGDVDIKESQICSPAQNILAPSKLTESNPFGNLSSSNKNKSVLRPSILATNINTSAKTTFTLNPSRLNPLGKPVDEGKDNCDNNKDANVDDKNAANGDSLKFVPLTQAEGKGNENVAKTVATSFTAAQATFVFGQNLEERVISDNASEAPKPSTSVTSNGTSKMLFCDAIKDKVKPESDVKETKSLSESAKEYEESRANKRKYDEVEVRTGEEGETNILHLSCKLFAFDKAGNWQERGRGNLRLNDLHIEDEEQPYTQSRLVFRTSGSLRVILNTKVWADMTIDQASSKSIRFTAIDNNGDIKVFLVMANPEEIKQLYKLLEQRLQSEKERQKHKKLSLTPSNSNTNH